MHEKIKSLIEIREILERDRLRGLKIVQCHGVFDLLHPGHIRHFLQAKQNGDRLVVTVTPDRFVNKGPGRPAFPESLRLESLAALTSVDYVVLNETPDAVHPIRYIRPHVYVKGIEYQDHAADVTGKIQDEVRAVQEAGGCMCYTDDLVFSSSSLLNRYFQNYSPELIDFLQRMKQRYRWEDLLQIVDDLSSLRVLVVGDAIFDEYQYVDPLGLAGKGLHMVARCMDRELFLGGALMVASHAAQFAKEVTLLTAMGAECPHRSFLEETLDPKIRPEFLCLTESTTLTKKRYISRDGATLTKLFETYSTQSDSLSPSATDQCIDFLKKQAASYDLVLVADFGNGFTNARLIQALSELPAFIAVNTQLNSGNRGFHVITHYGRADFVALNEPELRLAAHDRHTSVEALMVQMAEKLSASSFAVTRGVQGVVCWDREGGMMAIPALVSQTVDRVGAGDSFLTLAALALARGHSMEVAGFFGSVAAAIEVQIVGNRDPVRKAPFCKYLTRLLK